MSIKINPGDVDFEGIEAGPIVDKGEYPILIACLLPDGSVRVKIGADLSERLSDQDAENICAHIRESVMQSVKIARANKESKGGYNDA